MFFHELPTNLRSGLHVSFLKLRLWQEAVPTVAVYSSSPEWPSTRPQAPLPSEASLESAVR